MKSSSQRPGSAIARKSRNMYALKLAFILLIFGCILQPSFGQKEATTPTLSIGKMVIESLFRMKVGQSVGLEFRNEKDVLMVLSGKVETHLNPGENSGVLSASLESGKLKVKMLINRKLINGKLIYSINLLEPSTNEAYRLKSETKTEFVLEKTGKEKIVTE